MLVVNTDSDRSSVNGTISEAHAVVVVENTLADLISVAASPRNTVFEGNVVKWQWLVRVGHENVRILGPRLDCEAIVVSNGDGTSGSNISAFHHINTVILHQIDPVEDLEVRKSYVLALRWHYRPEGAVAYKHTVRDKVLRANGNKHLRYLSRFLVNIAIAINGSTTVNLGIDSIESSSNPPRSWA